MEELAVAIWRPVDVPVERTRDGLLTAWAPAALELPTVEALVVNVADVDQGGFRSGPAAFVTIGLSAAHDLDDLPLRDQLRADAARVEVWRVVTYRPKRYEVDWPVGTPSPGLKMVSLMERAEGISHVQFVQHWTERHAPLAVRHHIGLWNYEQHVVRRSYTPGGGKVDGIAELHFRTRDDYENKMFDDDAGRAAIFADIPHFMRLAESHAALMTEWVLR